MKKKVVFLPYDFDTAIGINNEGSLVFGYGLEDTDQTEGGADIFNGQQSVLWKNLRDCFPSELKTMYQNLRSQGTISYDVVEKMFEDHQAKWPEAIFNEDAWFKYLAPLEEENNASYLAMLQGSKASQRKWWLSNRFKYMDSKYSAGDAIRDVITLRGYAKDNITVVPYADIYVAVRYGSYEVQKRAKRGESVTLECPLTNVNDTEIYIRSAPQIASVGDLSGLKVGYADFSLAVKLQSLKLGDSSDTYDNGNLQTLYLGNNTLLQTIDVRNCSGLGTGEQTTVDISGCKNVREVYFDNTKITGITLPDGGVLTTLHLPGTITILKILNQNKLTDFECPDMTNISTLWLDNVNEAFDVVSVMENMPSGSRVRLFNFNWNLADEHTLNTFLDLLGTMRGLDQNGNNTEEAQVLGTVHVPNASEWLLNKAAKYSDLTVTYDNLYETVLYYNYDGSLIDFELVENGKDATREVAAERPTTNTTIYTFDGWAATQDGAVDETVRQNITKETAVYAHYSEATRYYRVRFYIDKDLSDTQYVVYGGYARYYDGASTPVYNGEGYAEDYTFIGWDKDLTNITENTDTYAQFAYRPVYTRKYLQDTLTDFSDPAVADDSLDQITYIEHYAFAGNTVLETINLPYLTFSEGEVPDMAFAQCRNVKSFTFASDLSAVLKIGDYSFRYFMGNRKNVDEQGNYVATSVTFPKATTIGKYAFYGAGDLSLDFPLVTTHGEGCFQQSYSHVIRLPSLLEIASNSYYYMRAVTEVYWSSISPASSPTTNFDSVSYLTLKVVDIGKTTRLSAHMRNFTKLETLIMRNDSLVTFQTSSVYSSGLFNTSSPLGRRTGFIYVPEALVDSYKAATGWKNYADVFQPIEGSIYEIKAEESGSEETGGSE